MQYKDLNDYELLYQIRENDDNAREKITYKYKPIIKKMALKYYHLIDGVVELEDLIQEGYIALNKALQKYNDEADNLFYTFVIRCIEMSLMNYCRDNSTKKKEVLSGAISIDDNELYNTIIDAEENIFDKVKYDVVFKEINSSIFDLDFSDALIFELKYNGFTYKEIANLLDIAITTVDKSLYKTKMFLRKRLKNYI